jgi:uncharacterized protein YndB with AHSA1/START domain
MRENKLKIVINKPASEVFDFYVDPSNTPLWVDSIVKEETNEWPIKLGTIYRNQNKAGTWSEYTVTDLKEDETFELTMKDSNYHVRYTHLPNNVLEYYEWVDEGELNGPFTQDILEKLKMVVESL